MTNKWLLLVVISLASISNAGGSAFDRDGVLSIQVSPDGAHFAVLVRQSMTDRLYVINIDETATVVSKEQTAPSRIESADWIGNDQLVIQLASDHPYEIAPRPTGRIELLSLNGSSLAFNEVEIGDADVQVAIAQESVYVVHSLPSVEHAVLIASDSVGMLWLVDTRSGRTESFPYPKLNSVAFIAAPNISYLLAEGTDDTEARRVQVLARYSDTGWQDIEPTLHPIRVNYTGLAYALLADDQGALSLVSLNLRTGQIRTHFEDQEYSVTHVSFGPRNEPFAVQYMPDYPSWNYLAGDKTLVALHKSLRAAMPEADVTVESTSTNARRFIARIKRGTMPDDFLLVEADAGRVQRLLSDESGPFIFGGDEDSKFETQPISLELNSEKRLHGYYSTPAERTDEKRPLVVLVDDSPTRSTWEWGFDTKAHYLNRHGFDVLVLNHHPYSEDGQGKAEDRIEFAAGDIDHAIDWFRQNDITADEKVCLFGRGSGADVAMRAAIGNSSVNCVISISGIFENQRLLQELGEPQEHRLNKLDILLVYGQLAEADYLRTQNQISDLMEDLGAQVHVFELEGERQQIVNQTSEAQALARIGTFLRDEIGDKRSKSAVPLTFEQAVSVEEVLVEFFDMIESGHGLLSDRIGNAKVWLRSQDGRIRKELSDEQWRTYEVFVRNDLGAREKHRPFYNRSTRRRP